MTPTEFSVKLGENLKEIRLMRNLSVVQLSEILDISPDDVRKYERGERALTVEKMMFFATALNCSPQNIIEGLDPRTGAKVKSNKEIRLMSAAEHKIMYYMSTEWEGNKKALIIANGIYMAIPPKRRREIVMALELQKDEALRKGEITCADLPEDIEYLEQALGNLYLI